ncbi:MAG: glycogen synthase GlgA, partial [bacterium]
MKILLAASEIVPFAKTGGLADVAGALPKALARRRQDVRVVMPRYRTVDPKAHRLKLLPDIMRIPVGGKIVPARLWEGKVGRDVPAYFVDIPQYFDRPQLYRTADGDYPDNAERFVAFARAALETAKAVDFKPDVIHCHDWQSALIPTYLKTLYANDAFFGRTGTIFTIHNIAYQGLFHPEALYLAGLGWTEFTPDRLEFYGQVNFLKGGLLDADLINTVSPTYAREIQSGPDFGRGLEGLLRARAADVFGVLNGLDGDEWDPEDDQFLPATFSAKVRKGKAVCKARLQAETGLAADSAIPLIGIVSRLDPQKGLDLILSALDEILATAQLIILGSGDRPIQEALASAAGRHAGRFAYHQGFDNSLAHRIYAGSDLFLMPSRFEPCGLGQLIAMRYGTVPVVTRTGGLADTVQAFDAKAGSGTGFVCAAQTVEAVLAGVREAVATFHSADR